MNNRSLQAELEAELRELGRRLGFVDGLRLVWQPGGSHELSGEVKGKTIYIYDADPAKAKRTLRHELVDYMVSSAIDPFKEVLNSVIIQYNRLAYQRKEEIVERLIELLD